VPNGNHTLQVDGWDAAGNLGHSIHAVPLTIANTGAQLPPSSPRQLRVRKR